MLNKNQQVSSRRLQLTADERLIISQLTMDRLKISIDSEGRIIINVLHPENHHYIMIRHDGCLSINGAQFTNSDLTVSWRGKRLRLSGMLKVLNALRESYLAKTVVQQLAGYASAQNLLSQFIGDVRPDINFFGEE